MFDQFYDQSSYQLKLSFLNKIIQQDPQLQEEFINFYLKPRNVQLKLTVEDPDDFISASVFLIKEDLEAIKFDELDWKNHVTSHSGYISHDDAFEHLAADEIGGIIGLHVAEVERYCSIKHFDLAFLYMVSIYQACLEAKLNEDYFLLENPVHTMLNGLENHLQDCLTIFKAIQVPEEQLFTLASVLFDLHTDSEDPNILSFFETYLHSLVHSGAEASILLDVMEDKNKAAHLPWLYTDLQKKVGGTESYEKAALKYYQTDVRVALELLEFYKTTDKSKFTAIAKQLWNKGLFHYECAELLFEVLDPKQEPKLYLEVAQFLNNRNFSEEYYQAIQLLMTEDDRMIYLNTLQNKHPAYITALCMEGKVTAALNHALLHTDRWNITETMTPCLMYDPHRGLKTLELKIEELLVDERGRNFYARVAEMLKIAAGIPEIQKETEKLVKSICSFYGRLTALKGELRAAGLI